MDVFEAFKANAEELMIKRGFKICELHKVLQKISKDASRQFPRLKVLYCDCYGLFGYSEEFKSFVKTKNSIPDSLATLCTSALQHVTDLDSNFKCSRVPLEDDHRVRCVPWIAPFGQHVVERWPMIAKLVKAYVRNDLGHRMQEIEKIASNTKSLIRIRKIRREIVAVRDRRVKMKQGRCHTAIGTHTKYNLKSLIITQNFRLYACSTLEAMCMDFDVEQSKLTCAIQEKRDSLLIHMTEAQYNLMLQSIDTKFDGERIDLALRCDPRRRRLSFIEGITQYGEQHYGVWQCQRVFNEKAMRFLLLHPEYTEIPASDEGNVDWTRELGLCAASGLSCKLQIADLPGIGEWGVRREPHAKDFGREGIYVL